MWMSRKKERTFRSIYRRRWFANAAQAVSKEKEKEASEKVEDKAFVREAQGLEVVWRNRRRSCLHQRQLQSHNHLLQQHPDQVSPPVLEPTLAAPFHIHADANLIGTPTFTIKPETTSSYKSSTLARQEPLARSSPSSRPFKDDKPIIPQPLGQIKRPLSLMFDINWAAAFAFAMSLPSDEQ
ncbi:hypothetical protein D9613_012824 [Agrocybe pediades]|uniref:Uncharacterized protein n=1 Tax=Agrocybe pediades TaxID=84607 RepID=A0A8H4R4L8_9AGAR|nr:hypothetical protein D9613_012824 [Agrocybe pediades]